VRALWLELRSKPRPLHSLVVVDHLRISIHLQRHDDVMATLRRFAHENHANGPSVPSTPVRGQPGPSTPRPKLVFHPSPFISPSRSASTPFDWEAARARRPAPYATPLGKRAAALRNASPVKGKPVKRERVIRKKSFFQKYVYRYFLSDARLILF
jgi:hypothetical protein